MPTSFREIAIPGSTSNLGPAFDALSVAVTLYLRLRILDARTDPAGGLDLLFEGPAPGGENRIEAAYRLACARVGRPGRALRVAVSSEIPMAAGLGSSAAAAVAGLLLYEAAAGVDLGLDKLVLATELERHPDNAAASLLGGMTVSCACDDGRIIARAWPWPPDIRLIVATPEVQLPTHTARAVVPERVLMEDAIANLQRALLLVRALESGEYGDIREAMKDRWHQPPRTPLVPGLVDALAIDHASVLGVCLSGAGPSVLALAAPGRAEEAAAVLGECYRRRGVPATIRNLAAHPPAATTLPLAAERERTA